MTKIETSGAGIELVPLNPEPLQESDEEIAKRHVDTIRAGVDMTTVLEATTCHQDREVSVHLMSSQDQLFNIIVLYPIGYSV